MDKRERIGDPEETLRTALDGRQAQLWTALPGIIQNFDPKAKTCTVQPAIKGKLRAPDGSLSSIAMPLLLDCPVYFPSGGGCTLTFPVTKGDECLVVFASRCIDAWWQSGGIQEQAEFRMHDLSDGFAFVGFSSLPNVPGAISTSTTQLRSNDGVTVVELDPAGQKVNVNAPGGIHFTGPVYANGKRIDETHEHSGVQPGSGNSGSVV